MSRPRVTIRIPFGHTGVATLVIVLVGLVTWGTAAWLDLTGSLPPQPLDFDHRLHMQEVRGVTCADCHPLVDRYPYAGLPGKRLCLDCHDPSDPASQEKPELLRLHAFAESPGDIPWQRVTALADDVYFSHRMHVVGAEIDCLECHPGFDQLTSPPRRGPLRMLMDECITCHEQQGANVDCIACHR